MPKTERTTAVYIRVSTTGQNEEGQRDEVDRWLEANGIREARYFVDKESGDHLERPAFEELQAAIFHGRIRTVVVWKLDRLSRSLKDGLEVLCDWCERKLRVVSVTQAVDFNGTIGKMIAAVLFGVAEMEQQNRRERQAAGIAVAKEKGKYRGRKPGTTKANPRRARRLREGGWTLNEIASGMGVSRMTVCRYLKA